MAVIDDFKTRFPEFDTGDVDTYLPPLVDVWQYYWGGEYTGAGVEIVLNLLAHLLTQQLLDNSSGSGTPLKAETSKHVGSVSVGYAVASPSNNRDEWLKSTSYGQRYLWLVKHHHGGVFV